MEAISVQWDFIFFRTEEHLFAKEGIIDENQH
jgi:hypothetical protein